MYAAYLNRTEPLDQIMRRVKSLWTEAKNLFGIRESHDFKLALVNPDTICRCRHCDNDSAPNVIRGGVRPVVMIRLNKIVVEREQDRVITDIIPHDIAHVVCIFRPALGHPWAHDEGWCKVLSELRRRS